MKSIVFGLRYTQNGNRGIGDATHGPQKRLPTSLTQASETKEKQATVKPYLQPSIREATLILTSGNTVATTGIFAPFTLWFALL